jgi:hypothetical protein
MARRTVSSIAVPPRNAQPQGGGVDGGGLVAPVLASAMLEFGVLDGRAAWRLSDGIGVVTGVLAAVGVFA